MENWLMMIWTSVYMNFTFDSCCNFPFSFSEMLWGDTRTQQEVDIEMLPSDCSVPLMLKPTFPLIYEERVFLSLQPQQSAKCHFTQVIWFFLIVQTWLVDFTWLFPVSDSVHSPLTSRWSQKLWHLGNRKHVDHPILKVLSLHSFVFRIKSKLKFWTVSFDPKPKGVQWKTKTTFIRKRFKQHRTKQVFITQIVTITAAIDDSSHVGSSRMNSNI